MYGWPVLVHYCETCGYNTPIEYSSTVWTQDHNCSHCGKTSPGADIAGQTSAKMNYSQHDELAHLFAQNMHLSGQAPALQAQQHQPQPQQPEEPMTIQQSMQDEKQHLQQDLQVPIYISTHYTPTAHIRIGNGMGDSHSEPSRSPPPPYADALLSPDMADILRQNSIDPSALLPNQILLFMNADYEQRLRLLELWRIAPPSYPLEDHLRFAQGPTSVAKEENAARLRYEAQMQQPQPPQPLISPIRQEGETHWPPAARMRAASIAAGVSPPSSTSVRFEGAAEPYILHGYSQQQQDGGLISRSAVEPVYGASPSGLWNGSANQLGNSMEDQYGMYEQIRNHADWERMNARTMQERLGGGGGGDDEMVM